MLSVEQRAQRELDVKNAELSAKIDKAKLEQLELHFQQDMDLLKKRLPTAQTEAVESAKDQAYLRDRQKSLVVCLVSLPKQLCFLVLCKGLEDYYEHSAFRLWTCCFFRKGQNFTKQWLDKHCKLVPVEDDMGQAMAEFGRTHSAILGGSGVDRVFFGLYTSCFFVPTFCKL